MRSNSRDGFVTPCAIISKNLNHLAPKIDTDFIDSGGVERGPDVRNCCSELLFWNSTFLRFLSSLVVVSASGTFPGGVKLRPRRSLEVRGSPELQNGGLRALGEAWMI